MSADGHTRSDGTGRSITISEALNEALREEMTRDASVIVLGEDIAAYGGTFDVTKDLLEEFGDERIYGTAISEAAIIGAGVGSALAGMRPVAEIMFNDFLTCGMDQLINHAALLTYAFGGQVTIPLVVRTTTGTHGGPQHSKSLEAWLTRRAWSQGRDARNPVRRQGVAQECHPRQQPCRGHRESSLYRTEGPVPTGSTSYRSASLTSSARARTRRSSRWDAPWFSLSRRPNCSLRTGSTWR